MGDAHDDIPELSEQGSLKGFGEKIRDHDASWAVGEVYFAACDSVLDEEISDIYVSGALSSG